MAKPNLDMPGKVFGRLRVKNVKKSRNGRLWWLCLCTCGNEKFIQGKSLRLGLTKSCGCLARETASKTKRKEKGYSGLTLLLGQYKSSASTKGLPFELTREEFRRITSSECCYCGSPPRRYRHDGSKLLTERGRLHGRYVFNGVDRKNNNKGYTKGNSVPCCTVCNVMKRTMSSDEFINHCRKIVENTDG